MADDGPLRLGSRGSDLAMHQAHRVRDALTGAHPDLAVDIVEVSTKGDLDKRSRLDVIAGRGIFVRELDLKVADGTLHGAVHSLKDVPTELIEGVRLVCHLPRGPPGDVLISRHGPFDDLPDGARIGTSSPRRRAQLLRARPDLEVVDLRGNVDTRVGKALGELDGAVLARAGVDRLGLDALGLDASTCTALGMDRFPPAPGQGIICATARPGTDTADRLAAVDDPATSAVAAVERAVIATLGVGCHTPLGVRTEPAGEGRLRLLAELLALDGSETVRREDVVPAGDATEAADGAAALAAGLKRDADHLL